jgi:2-octaprenyl-6-methoxyphenol hydroxylase
MGEPRLKPDGAADRPAYDVLIVGGGLVGASLALALGRSSVNVALVESNPLPSPERPSADTRPLALALGSRQILQGIGLWSGLVDQVTPIREVHVSDRGHFGCTRISAREQRADALGYVTEARNLANLVAIQLIGHSAVEVSSPGSLEALSLDNGAARIRLRLRERAKVVHARLVVAADGARSTVREMLGIGQSSYDYGQVALTASVQTSVYHRNRAFERFTERGVVALLPMEGSKCGLVWSLAPEQADALVAAAEADFLSVLQEQFGSRLGRFEQVHNRRCYPLRLLLSGEQVRPRLVLVGNAARTLHPVAGQGFNLGLRDVAQLAELVADAVRGGRDPGSVEVLSQYAHLRRCDQGAVTHFTDKLVRLFSLRFAPVVAARCCGLLALDLIPPIKRELGRQAMGLAGRQTRLARGLPL